MAERVGGLGFYQMPCAVMLRLLRYAMPCDAMLCYAMLCYAMQCNNVHCYVMSVMLFYVM